MPTAAREPGSCDASSILQVARRTGLTCAHGEEEYTLAEWERALYSEGDRPANGVTIVDFRAPDSDCSQPGILIKPTSSPFNGDIEACDCKALVMVSPDTTPRSTRVCTSTPASRISLEFDEPQDIVSVTFQSVAEDGSTFSYVTATEPGIAPSSEIVNMPVNGFGQPSTADLDPPAQSVTDVEIQLRGKAAFIGMKLCKGGGSLVGDPHVRTQDHAHYTVLNEGNFLAWRFNSKTELALKSDLKKAETC